MELASHPLMLRMSAEMRPAVAAVTSIVRVAPQGLIFEEGSIADSVYLILEGQLSFFKTRPGCPPAHIGDSKAGDCFGELGLVEVAPRALCAIAGTEVLLAKIPLVEFHNIIEEHAGGYALEILRNIIRHLR